MIPSQNFRDCAGITHVQLSWKKKKELFSIPLTQRYGLEDSIIIPLLISSANT